MRSGFTGKQVVSFTGVCLLACVAVLAAEVVVSIRAPRLPESSPYDLNRPALGGTTRVLWLGDSTAAGVGASTADNALPLQVAQHSVHPVDVTSFAMSGAKIGDLLRKQLPLVAAAKPDVVYISIGANDVTHRTSGKQFEREYQQLLSALSAYKVVVLGVPDMGSPTRVPQPLRAIMGLKGQQLNAVSRKVAENYGATYVDVGAYTKSSFREHPDKYFASDGFHPDDDGYGLWTQAVIGRFQP